MEKAVAHACLVYIARLRIANPEMLIAAMAISAVCEIPVQGEDVRHQVALERLHVLLLALATYELFPGREQVFERNDILVRLIIIPFP